MLSERVTNPGAAPVRFVWGHHLVLGGPRPGVRQAQAQLGTRTVSPSSAPHRGGPPTDSRQRIRSAAEVSPSYVSAWSRRRRCSCNRGNRRDA